MKTNMHFPNNFHLTTQTSEVMCFTLASPISLSACGNDATVSQKVQITVNVFSLDSIQRKNKPSVTERP